MLQVNVKGIATIQDVGRAGLTEYGVSETGPLDRFSYTIGNWLAFNRSPKASIELLFGTLIIHSVGINLISITGTFDQLKKNSRILTDWRNILLRHGDELTIHRSQMGGAAYLAMQGGLGIPEVLGSRSTDIKGRIGFNSGKPLIGTFAFYAENGVAVYSILNYVPQVMRQPSWLNCHVLHMCMAPETELVPQNCLLAVVTRTWNVAPHSGRLGFRFSGMPEAYKVRHELLSYGIRSGLVQLPPDGKPVVHGPEANTCGGYPRIGMLQRRYLDILGQKPIGSPIIFKLAAREEAIIIEEKYQKEFLHWKTKIFRRQAQL